MSNQLRVRHEIRADLPAHLDAVDELVRLFRNDLKFCSKKDWFETEILIREALNNAIVHGSHCHPSRRVHCTIRIGRCHFLIFVRDEGNGFEWQSAIQSKAPETSCSGRGIEIYTQFANRFRFNTSGNCVTIIKKFQKGNPCQPQ